MNRYDIYRSFTDGKFYVTNYMAPGSFTLYERTMSADTPAGAATLYMQMSGGTSWEYLPEGM